MLFLHNTFRIMEGFQPLFDNKILNEEAQKYAKRMARLSWLSDYKLKERLDKLIEFDEIVWNISIGSNFEVAIKKLINDREARLKIFGNYTEFGCGSHENRNGNIYWCLLYGRLKE
jgi:uncharacterized protein YkwD